MIIHANTDVISEPWKPAPDTAVLTLLDAQAIETLFISAISIAELRFGIASMSSEKLQTILHDRLEGEVLPIFDRRILPFSAGAAQFYAELMAGGRTSGKAIGEADEYIAATATEDHLTVATRYTSRFEAAGLSVITLGSPEPFRIAGRRLECHHGEMILSACCPVDSMRHCLEQPKPLTGPVLAPGSFGCKSSLLALNGPHPASSERTF